MVHETENIGRNDFQHLVYKILIHLIFRQNINDEYIFTQLIEKKQFVTDLFCLVTLAVSNSPWVKGYYGPRKGEYCAK